METPSRVLGVDPGLVATGYCVLEMAPGGAVRLLEGGVVRTPGEASLERRLKELHGGLREVVAEFQPEAVAVEALYAHYRHPRTAILMAHARGVVLLVAAEAAVAVESYAATQVKEALTGQGRATKRQVQQMVQRRLALARPPEPPDVADAAAVALCHYDHTRDRRTRP
ncbi:MAG: crossover junction endodeoxyribonuclease RuvC [Nitrospinota bacterium]